MTYLMSKAVCVGNSGRVKNPQFMQLVLSTYSVDDNIVVVRVYISGYILLLIVGLEYSVVLGHLHSQLTKSSNFSLFDLLSFFPIRESIHYYINIKLVGMPKRCEILGCRQRPCQSSKLI